MFLVHRYNVKTTGQEAHSTQKYDDNTAAMKRFYSILAADIDNGSYVFELVQVIRDDGIVTASQVFDNRPEPEPVEE